jgi:hypothetical protein
VSTISSSSDLQNSKSPQAAAFEWLVNTDPEQVCPANTLAVKERYVAAVLYFSTDGNQWRQCNAPQSPKLSPCTGAQRYLSNSSVCQWFGNTCDSAGDITEISISKLPKRYHAQNQNSPRASLMHVISFAR